MRDAQSRKAPRTANAPAAPAKDIIRPHGRSSLGVVITMARRPLKVYAAGDAHPSPRHRRRTARNAAPWRGPDDARNRHPDSVPRPRRQGAVSGGRNRGRSGDVIYRPSAALMSLTPSSLAHSAGPASDAISQPFGSTIRVVGMPIALPTVLRS